MTKIMLIFLTICFIAITNAHQHQAIPATYEDVEDYSPEEVVGVPVEDSDYTELYVAFANRIFDFFATLVRGKVELVIWVKRALIGMMVNTAVYLKHWMATNGVTVSDVMNSAVRVMKIFGLNEREHVAEYDTSHY